MGGRSLRKRLGRRVQGQSAPTLTLPHEGEGGDYKAFCTSVFRLIQRCCPYPPVRKRGKRPALSNGARRSRTFCPLPSRSSLPLPHAKELLQAGRVRLIGANLEAVDVGPAKPAGQSLFSGSRAVFAKQCPHARGWRVSSSSSSSVSASRSVRKPTSGKVDSRGGSPMVTATQSCRYLAIARAREQSGPRKSLMTNTTHRRRWTRPRKSRAFEMSVCAP